MLRFRLNFLMKKDTSWEKSAEWYDALLTKGDTYQEKVILPNLLRFLKLKNTEKLLDCACGQGYFTKHFTRAGCDVFGADISESLIALARVNVSEARFFTSDAARLQFANDTTFDVVVCVLGLQNMEDLRPVFASVARVLKKGGRFVFVLNHPAFRIPKASAWGWDGVRGMQFRRIDAYLTPARAKIDMHPGKNAKEFTYSFHRSLQDYIKALCAAKFAVTRLEEWISHRASQKGPRARAEDRARKEIPLFLAVEAKLTRETKTSK